MKIAATGTTAAGDFLIYHGSYDVILPKMARAGYQYAELHILDSAQIDRPALWKQLEDCGLTLTTIGTGSAYHALHYCLGSSDPTVRRAAVRHMEEHMLTAQKDHATVIIGLIAGKLADSHGNLEEFQKNVTESLYQLDGLAKKYDVSLCLELLNRYESDWLHRIEEGVSYLKQNNLERVKLHIDTYHMNIEEADIGAAIRSAGAYIGHVHLADSDRWYPGHGHYDFEETFRALQAVNYQGAMAVECNNFPNEDICGEKALEYASCVMKKIAENTP